MSTPKGINVFPEIKDACLGCTSEMPYRTVDEAVAGVTIQVHLRYCDGCHKATLKSLADERSLNYAHAHIAAVSTIFDALRRTEGR